VPEAVFPMVLQEVPREELWDLAQRETVPSPAVLFPPGLVFREATREQPVAGVPVVSLVVAWMVRGLVGPVLTVQILGWLAPLLRVYL
jgi:hypothetical protein